MRYVVFALRTAVYVLKFLSAFSCLSNMFVMRMEAFFYF